MQRPRGGSGLHRGEERGAGVAGDGMGRKQSEGGWVTGGESYSRCSSEGLTAQLHQPHSLFEEFESGLGPVPKWGSECFPAGLGQAQVHGATRGKEGPQ